MNVAATTEAIAGWMTRPATTVDRPRLSYREELVSCMLGTWLLAGLYVDGWAHRSLDLRDSIATPWHAILYSGFIAYACWILYVVAREYRAGRRGLAAAPVGYAIGFAGVLSFTIGGLGDQIWHLALGVEQDLNAFQSPTHWFLAIGMFLMASCPLRSGWSSEMTETPSFKAFLPTMWSLVLTLAMVMFAWNYMSYFIADSPTISNAEFVRSLGPDTTADQAFTLTEKLRILGIAMITITTLSYMAAILFALRRWRPPFGTATFVFGVPAAAVNAIWEYRFGWVVTAAIVGGLFADWLIARIDPKPSRVVAYRVFAFAVPAVMWLTYYFVLAVAHEMNWPPEMWVGTMFMTTLVSVLLSVMMVPIRNPVSAGGDR